MVQRVKRLLTRQETSVRSLGREDPLEKEMATHSSTLAWRIPWREEPGRLQSMGSRRVRHDFTFTIYIYIYIYIFFFLSHSMSFVIIITYYGLTKHPKIK